MKILIWVMVLLTASGCSVKPVAPITTTAELSEFPLHVYTQQLADNLFAQLPKTGSVMQPAAQIAVASFVPVNSLSLSTVDEAEKQLANQLSESMLTHARQHGFTVFDYRLRQQLLLLDDHAQALSRQLEDISAASDADTLLAGTYTPMEDGYLLNARLISVTNQKVLAAASGYIPANVLWGQRQVVQQGDMLYRRSMSGETK